MTFLSDELVEQIAGRVQRGVPLQTALKAAGITDAMVREWEHLANDKTTEDEELRTCVLRFSERIGRAQAECEVTLIEGIAETSTMVGKSGLPEWRAGAWLLNNHPGYRQTYRLQREVEVRTIHTVPLEHRLVEAADDNDLEHWAALPEADQ